RSSRQVCALLLERQQRGARPVRQVNRRIDRRVAGIIERCLADRPAHRAQTAAGLHAALRGSLLRKSRVRRLRVILSVGVLIFLTGATGLYMLYEGHPLERGKEAYRSRRYDRAVLYFNRVLKTSPQDARALFARGRAHLKAGNV